MKSFWAQFRKDKLALAGLGTAFVLILLGILAPLLAPYDLDLGKLATTEIGRALG